MAETPLPIPILDSGIHVTPTGQPDPLQRDRGEGERRPVLGVTAARVRRCFLLLALLFSLPATAPADTLSALVVTSAAADCATTEWALSRPGTRELNPLLQGPAQRVGFKVVATAAVLVG